MDKISDELFLRTKALILANELRANIHKLRNVCEVLHSPEQFLDLLEAVDTSAVTIHQELDTRYDIAAAQADMMANDFSGMFFDTDADEDEDEDNESDEGDESEEKTSLNPTGDELKITFHPNEWYRGVYNGKPFNMFVCTRFQGDSGTELVADIDGDEYILPVMVHVGSFLHGKATELVKGTIVDPETDEEHDFKVYSIKHINAEDL